MKLSTFVPAHLIEIDCEWEDMQEVVLHYRFLAGGDAIVKGEFMVDHEFG